MKLIDKSALVAEIEKKRKDYIDSLMTEHIYTLNEVLDLINTLEVKEVDFVKETKKNVDLEDEIDKELDEEWYGEYINHAKFRKSAKHFFELGLKATQNEYKSYTTNKIK